MERADLVALSGELARLADDAGAARARLDALVARIHDLRERLAGESGGASERGEENEVLHRHG